VTAASAFLRGWVAGDGLEVAVLAALAFVLGGESGLLDFINDGVREACHKAGTTIAEPLPARNQKIPIPNGTCLPRTTRGVSMSLVRSTRL
jgi:hypothetical protein